MHKPITPVHPGQLTGSSPALPPDVYTAGLAAAIQTYTSMGAPRGIPNEATIDNVVTWAGKRNRISSSVSASIRRYLQTPASATVIGGSVDLATRAFDYIKAHAGGPMAADPPPSPHPGGNGIPSAASPLGLHGGLSAKEPEPPSPADRLTPSQKMAAIEATNDIMRRNGQPSFSEKPGSGQPGQAPPINDPPLEQDWLDKAVIGLGVGSLLENVGEAVVGEGIASFFDSLTDPGTDGNPDSQPLPPNPDDPDPEEPENPVQVTQPDDPAPPPTGDGGDSGGDVSGGGSGGGDKHDTGDSGPGMEQD